MTIGCGAAICLAAQPSTVFGSPDTMVRRGVEDTLGATEKLADAIVAAVRGKSSARAISAAIDGAAKRFKTDSIAKPIERELLQGSMLGVLDAWFEAETDELIAPERFSSLPSSITLADPFHDTKFAARPLREAVSKFLERKAVTRAEFDSMAKDARKRAFTVAGAANEEMVRTVKRELIRQVAVGADLREFGKHAAKRFISAGWTPANASHVETVFRTNVMNSYSGGRVRQMTQPVVLETRPYWESVPVGDGPPRQRAAHRNFVLRASDPFWKEAAPPYGYNCRCRLRSLSVKQGAGRVQEGSSIKGLPDPGFSSGIGTLFAGSAPSTEPPKGKPANDPPPEQQPANDPAPGGRRRRQPKRTGDAIQAEIDDLRRKVGNISRRRKAVPQAEFDELRRRIEELQAELQRI